MTGMLYLSRIPAVSQTVTVYYIGEPFIGNRAIS